MTPANRQTIEAALALIADVNDADAWDMLTAETRAQDALIPIPTGVKTEIVTDPQGASIATGLAGRG
jgi:hypothetical protein